MTHDDILRTPISRRGLARTAGVATLAGFTAAATTGAADPAAAAQTRKAPREGSTLVLLGTRGGPSVAGGSCGIATGLVVGDAFYLIDLGHGALGQVAEAGLNSAAPPGSRALTGLAGVFLTHMHSDHLAEYASLIINGIWNGVTDPSAPVPVYGPGDRGGLPPVLGDRPEPPLIGPGDPTAGTVRMTERVLEAFAADLNERLRGSGGANPAEVFDVHDIALPDGVDGPVDHSPMPRIRPFTVHEDSRARVTATLVEHSPVFPAFAFRFDTDDGSVTISGDTAPSENLIELAQGTDVLLHEVIDPDWINQRYPEPRTPDEEATVKHLFESHTTIDDVGPVAESAGAGTLVLTHMVPSGGPPATWNRARHGFSGKFRVGRDLDEIPLGR